MTAIAALDRVAVLVPRLLPSRPVPPSVLAVAAVSASVTACAAIPACWLAVALNYGWVLWAVQWLAVLVLGIGAAAGAQALVGAARGARVVARRGKHAAARKLAEQRIPW